ncbi:glycosyltransferase [Micrococcus luteus]|uniref:glycosyltransferase n=1 Tax=Micrococcus luteus TaxID=1270 RepID=UPI001D0CC9D9|nr:glycosyltransferase [Micrococcus luteus]MCC0766864.1 glycosyltransferase [Micrococcus luteus]
MKPTVSVIIPCYNAEAWIGRQIPAVLAQLGPEDELVLVDNLSTDATPALLAEAAAADPRARVVTAADRQGVNHARNVGLAEAQGDILLICDADDRIHAGWVEAFRSAFSDSGVAGGAAIPVDGNGRRVGEDLGLHHVFGGPPYPLGANMAMTRDVFDAVGGFDESFRGGHDEADFAWRAADAGFPTLFVPEARIDYLQRSDVRGVVTQRRNYARTAIQLWTRHPHLVDPLGVSLRGALQGALTGLSTWGRVLRGSATLEDGAEWGWRLGTLEGHLRYRVLGRPPAPLITHAETNPGGRGMPPAVSHE